MSSIAILVGLFGFLILFAIGSAYLFHEREKQKKHPHGHP
ncbi:MULTISPECIES: hypothetical protein [Gammaproteobacteria]|uniref:MetS family NSS transporter small subunit n=2 Tax=Gammaproteobacteria TaxID=1236 RepID=A0AAX3NYK6_9GAMM|nr:MULTISPECIES: hypothetical protein [Gammaproteobacteria]MDV0844425.1 hypothetical protein [Klebsiella quasipneumoniae subsp. quasipneumoniae]WED79219.1 hypothetical protein PYU98_25020 [Aeromonas allosaccharophila]